MTLLVSKSFAWSPTLNDVSKQELKWSPSKARFSSIMKTSVFMSTESSNVAQKMVKYNENSGNVVLRPSYEKDENFDSFLIGSPRVHRYTRDASVAASDAEYVMWYHGRSTEMKESKILPPLSTGRIGRAFSKNGLHWEKSTSEPLGASLAEDMDGVSLGLNKDEWWSFDTAHVGLGQVLLPMSNPAVITEGGVYLMYFMGGSLEETDLSLYLDSDSEQKIKGMKMKIGVALSQDGKAWGRIEGDDPTGAVMVPYDKSDTSQKLNVDDSSAAIWNVEEELYCAWPDVYINLNTRSGEQAFNMYYSTMTKHGKQKVIARAVSEDGFRWFKRGVCLRPDKDTDESLDADGCARANVFKKLEYDTNKEKWEDTPKRNAPWIMHYEGVSSKDGKHRILKAESDDGFTWVKKGIVLDVGEGDESWDSYGVGSSHILRMDDGTLRMYYTGQNKDKQTAIGVARTNEDGIFVREQAEFSFA